MSTKTAIALQDPKGTSLTAPAGRPAFTGTIASACESIGLDNFIDMTRLARTNDPRAERFMDAWDALDRSEQQARGAADVVCARLGLVPIELLRVVAEAVYNFSMYVAQMKATLALPSVVERSVEVALTDKGVADRRMLLQSLAFLPTPKGSHVAIAVTQNAQARAADQSVVVAAPRPEDVIRGLTDRFNEARELRTQPLTPPPPARVSEDSEEDYE